MMRYTHEHPMRVMELFAGYGSQAMALQRIKENVLGFDYIIEAISEIEPNALKAYELCHGHCPNLGDITKIDWGGASRTARP